MRKRNFSLRIFLVAIVCVTGAQWLGSRPRGLPHRPVDELTNWGQGHAPELNRCPPGTVRIETDEGWFLECLRGYTR